MSELNRTNSPESAIIAAAAARQLDRGARAEAVDPVQAEYDDLPYPDGSFPQTHPGRLAAIGTLFGMSPANVERCRVLEIGCGQGGNIVPMAASLPGSEFVGIDLSDVHIARTKSLADAAGVQNLTLHRGDILKFDFGSEPFDFIIAHGLISWVPREVRMRAFSLCDELLAPQGIAYLSYNIYPGWSRRKSVCDFIRMHCAATKGFELRVRAAGEALDFLEAGISKSQEPHSITLREIIQSMRIKDRRVFFHDDLGAINDPCYFLQFIDWARQNGLGYVADSSYASMLPDNMPSSAQDALKKFNVNDSLQREQYMDYLRNRTFRMSLLCRSQVAVSRTALAEKLRGLRLRSRMKAPAIMDMSAGAMMKFANDAALGINSAQPWIKSFLLHLSENAPRYVSWQQAADHATAAAGAKAGDLDQLSKDALELCLYCLGKELMDVSTFSPDLPREVPEYPRATGAAREQARREEGAANLLHEWAVLSDEDRAVLGRLDGKQHRSSLPAGILNDLRELSFILPQESQATNAPSSR